MSRRDEPPHQQCARVRNTVAPRHRGIPATSSPLPESHPCRGMTPDHLQARTWPSVRRVARKGGAAHLLQMLRLLGPQSPLHSALCDLVLELECDASLLEAILQRLCPAEL